VRGTGSNLLNVLARKGLDDMRKLLAGNAATKLTLITLTPGVHCENPVNTKTLKTDRLSQTFRLDTQVRKLFYTQTHAYRSCASLKSANSAANRSESWKIA